MAYDRKLRQKYMDESPLEASEFKYAYPTESGNVPVRHVIELENERGVFYLCGGYSGRKNSILTNSPPFDIRLCRLCEKKIAKV